MRDVHIATNESKDERHRGRPLSFGDFDSLHFALTGHDGKCRSQYRFFTDLETWRIAAELGLENGKCQIPQRPSMKDCGRSR